MPIVYILVEAKSCAFKWLAGQRSNSQNVKSIIGNPFCVAAALSRLMDRELIDLS